MTEIYATPQTSAECAVHAVNASLRLHADDQSSLLDVIQDYFTSDTSLPVRPQNVWLPMHLRKGQESKLHCFAASINAY